MKLHATRHSLIPILAMLAFVIGLSCSPRVHAVGVHDTQHAEVRIV
jgi:hypothetical protein